MDDQKRDDEMTADDGRVAIDKVSDDELSDDEMSDDTSGYLRAMKKPDEDAGPDGRIGVVANEWASGPLGSQWNGQRRDEGSYRI